MVKNFFIALTLLVFTSLVQAQNQPFSAFVDRTNITINDVITLTLRLDVSMGNSRPSTNGLNQNFEQVGGINQRSTYTNTNGNIQAWTEYSIMLRPLTTGTLTIPAFRVGNETTSPIQITVKEASAITEDSQDDIFLRTSISKTESYVQEQLLYTIRIYYAIGFDQGAQLSSPQVENAVVQQLGSDNNYQEVLNGISYNVTERRFVIFPQQSGELTIAPVYFNASVGRRGGINRFFNNRQQVREINLTSESHTIDVKPQPETFDGTTWLPAAELRLEETWSNDADTVQVGDAITRNVTLTATGLSSSLLPGIEYQDLQGLRFYPDQPVRSDTADRDGVVGKRSEGTAIVASQPGDFVLPEVRMPWWNTVTDRLEVATLPARTIRVLPSSTQPDVNAVSPSVSASDAPVIPSSSDDSGAAVANPIWVATTAVFALLWAFTTFLLLRSKQQLAYVETTGVPQPQVRMPDQAVKGASLTSSPLSDPASSLRVLKTACDSGNLHDMRRALLKWGQGSLQNPELLTLEQLAGAIGDGELAQQLRELDKALYGSADKAQYPAAALYDRVATLHKNGMVKSAGTDKYALRPLYRS